MVVIPFLIIAMLLLPYIINNVEIIDDNISFKSDNIKLIDFGTAKLLYDYTNTTIGTPHYMAPEVLKGKCYSLSCDFWSIGICMYEIFYGYCPFGKGAKDVMDIYQEIIYKDLYFPVHEKEYEHVNNLLSE
jgi:cGMP-dependent protein kinase